MLILTLDSVYTLQTKEDCRRRKADSNYVSGILPYYGEQPHISTSIDPYRIFLQLTYFV